MNTYLGQKEHCVKNFWPLTKKNEKKYLEKQRGQDLEQKTMFFHPKIFKICVT